ncbi:MAG: hypothetical protein ACXAEU_01710 [Candidatus Hodarchaeales archaeon]
MPFLPEQVVSSREGADDDLLLITGLSLPTRELEIHHVNLFLPIPRVVINNRQY